MYDFVAHLRAACHLRAQSAGAKAAAAPGMRFFSKIKISGCFSDFADPA